MQVMYKLQKWLIPKIQQYQVMILQTTNNYPIKENSHK
jgi:hypothetical protein